MRHFTRPFLIYIFYLFGFQAFLKNFFLYLFVYHFVLNALWAYHQLFIYIKLQRRGSCFIAAFLAYNHYILHFRLNSKSSFILEASAIMRSVLPLIITEPEAPQ